MTLRYLTCSGKIGRRMRQCPVGQDLWTIRRFHTWQIRYSVTLPIKVLRTAGIGPEVFLAHRPLRGFRLKVVFELHQLDFIRANCPHRDRGIEDLYSPNQLANVPRP